MSCGLLGPSINGSPARTRSPSCTLTCTPRGSAYSRGSAPGSSGNDDDLPLALDDAAVLDDAVDFRDDRRLARLARFEQLHHARQTARDVLGLGRLARNLREDVARRHHLAVLHHQVRVRRHVVFAVDLAVLALDLHGRLLLLVRRVDDDEAREAGDLVDFLVHRDAFENVLEADLARLLGEDRERVRIPLDEHLALLDRLAFLHLEARAVDDRIALAVAPLRVLHDERSAAVHDDQVAVLRLDDLQALEPDGAGVARFERRLLRTRATPCRRCGTSAS